MKTAFTGRLLGLLVLCICMTAWACTASAAQAVCGAVDTAALADAQTVSVGDTVSTDMVSMTLKSTRFTVCLDYEDKPTYDAYATGSLSSLSTKIYLWFEFDWKNLSKESLSLQQFGTIAEYGDGYTYPLMLYADHPGWSTIDGNWQKIKLISPLEEDQAWGAISMPRNLRFEKESIRLVFSLPSSEGQKLFAFQLKGTEDAVPVTDSVIELVNRLDELGLAAASTNRYAEPCVKQGKKYKVAADSILTKWYAKVRLDSYKDAQPSLYKKLIKIQKAGKSIASTLKKTLNKKTAQSVITQCDAILKTIDSLARHELSLCY